MSTSMKDDIAVYCADKGWTYTFSLCDCLTVGDDTLGVYVEIGIVDIECVLMHECMTEGYTVGDAVEYLIEQYGWSKA